MRALFWRRKNARLATRLNTLVETSERERKTRRRKPSRVVIDTSYLEQAEAQVASQTEEPHGTTVLSGRQRRVQQDVANAVAPDPSDDHQIQSESAFEHDVALHDDAENDDEASIILREAIEQLDHAEAGEAEALEREAAALREIDVQRARVEELEAGLADAQQARVVAEQSLVAEHENADAPAAQLENLDEATDQELETHRAMVERLSADLRREQKVRAQAAADRDAADSRAAAAELKLTNLQDTETEFNKATARATAAEARAAAAAKDVESGRDRCKRLEADVSEAQTARDTAETATATAEKRATELEQQIEALQQAARDAAALEQRAADAETELKEARTALAEAQADAKALTDKLADYEGTRAELSDVTEQLAAAKRLADDSAVRETAVQGELEAQQETNKGLTGELEALRTTLAEAEAGEAGRVAVLDREIDELRQAAAQQEVDAEAGAAAAREQTETQRDAVTRLEADLKNQREALAEAETAKEALTARAVASERRLVDAQRAATEIEAALRAEAEAQRTARAELEAKRDSQDADQSASEADQTRCNAELERTTAGALARTAQIENERDVLRRQLAEVQRAADAATERSRDSEQELADLRQAAAQRELADQVCDAAQDRETTAHRELEAERQRLSEIEAELTQERDARADAEARLNETLKQVSDDRSDAFAVGGTVELEPVEAEPPEVASTDTTELVVTALADTKPEEPAPVTVSEHLASTVPTTKRSSRITAKSDPNGVSAAAMTAAGPTSRVGNLIQNRIAKATAKKEAAKENRRAKRVSARKIAALWQDGMSAPLSCTMLDRSSTGAKLEILTDRFNDRMNELAVGDRFTVTQTYAQERTSVACEIMWVDGQRCGVRFCGQIHTEIQKPAKKALPKQVDKPSTSKAIKSLFGAGAR